MDAGDAFGARFVEGKTSVHARRDTGDDADALDDAIHELGLAKNPVEHRPVKAKIGHFAPPLANLPA
jgi:hypothetical protein